MNENAHFIQQQTDVFLRKQKRAWALFLVWMDQSDDEVMTVRKKQEFLDCLDDEERSAPDTLPFPATLGVFPPSPRAGRLPRCG